MLSSSLPSPPPRPCNAVVGQEMRQFLSHPYPWSLPRCAGASLHFPAQLSLSQLKPSLTHCCHNKPTLAVSPQHPPAFCFSSFKSPAAYSPKLSYTHSHHSSSSVLLPFAHSFKPQSNMQTLVHFQAAVQLQDANFAFYPTRYQIWFIQN